MQTKNFIEFNCPVNDKEIRLQMQGGVTYGQVLDCLIEQKNELIKLTEAQFPHKPQEESSSADAEEAKVE